MNALKLRRLQWKMGGIEQTDRELQPFNVWVDGFIVWFAKDREEAEQKLKQGGLDN